jgi:hypothetical protein
VRSGGVLWWWHRHLMVMAMDNSVVVVGGRGREDVDIDTTCINQTKGEATEAGR